MADCVTMSTDVSQGPPNELPRAKLQLHILQLLCKAEDYFGWRKCQAFGILIELDYWALREM